MAALARLAQIVNGAPRHHFAPMTQERLQHLLQAEKARLSVDERDHVDAEYLFHRRLGEQVVQQNLRYLAALQFNDHAHAVLVGLVAQPVRGDALDELLAHQIRDALDQLRLVDLVGKLRDDDGLPVALADVLDVRAGTHVQPAASGFVGRDDFLRAVDEARGRKVRPRDDLHELGEREIRLLDERDARRDDLPQVVRRDVGGHAHRDARGAVHQEIRHPRRQHRGLALRLVVVRNEVDGFLVDVREQFARQPRHAHFGIAHGRRRIAVDRTEIPLAVDQQVAHRERLRHAHDGVVHRRIAVRMVFADHIADHAGRFLVRAVPVVAELAHGVEHAPVNGFQPVPNVGKRPPHDDAHGVIQIGFTHLVLEIYGQNFACDLGHVRESG